MSHTRERLRRFLIRAISRTHGGVYRASGGRLLGRVVGMPVLLLTTTGRRSGKPRTAATAEEHDRLWPLVTTTHPGYARYQERTARLIPIVMLTARGR
jgi:hypothetical protein